MPHWETRARIVRLSVAVAVILLLAVAFVPPPSHDVHSPDGVSIKARIVYSGPTFRPIVPSESLSDIRCQLWGNGSSAVRCPTDAILAQDIWPQVNQSPLTLYVGVLSTCGYRFNVEYRAHDRRLLVHCYSAGAWIAFPASCCPGVMASPTLALVLVSTDAIPSGRLTVTRDDRIERWLSDQSAESQLGSVIIS